jgi:tetratricopeptide (TPR) repeat protein
LTWTPLELGWSLRDRVVSAFAKPLKELQTISAKAVGPAALADANEPGLFQRACMTGLAAITDLAREEILPDLVRAVLRKLPDHYTELLSLLQPPSHALMLAAPDIRKIQHVTGMAGLLHKGAQAANPKTIRGTAAIGGAAVGSVIMPGIGTAIGGAIGYWLGNSESTVQDTVAIDHFQNASRLMWAAVDDLLRNTWNIIGRMLLKKEGPDLPDSAYYETACIRWESLKASFHEPIKPDKRDSIRAHLDVFFRDWGPHPEALELACRLCLVPFPLDLDLLQQLATRFRELYPTHAAAYVAVSRLQLEQNNYTEGLASVEQGLKLAPNSIPLQQARIELLAAMDRVAEVEVALQRFPKEEPDYSPRLSLVRGLVRANKQAEAIEQIRLWIHKEGKPAVVVQELGYFPRTASLLAENQAQFPELDTVFPGRDGDLQAIVQYYLSADGKASFLGPLPPEKDQTCHKEFPPQPGEVFLFVYDWSEWHLVKGSLAITNRRLMWKHGWDKPVSIELSQTVPSIVSATKSDVKIGGRSIDVRNEDLATALVKTIKEMTETVGGPG